MGVLGEDGHHELVQMHPSLSEVRQCPFKNGPLRSEDLNPLVQLCSLEALTSRGDYQRILVRVKKREGV